MSKVTFPLRRRARGPEVADLQDVLRRLLEHGRLLANDEGAHRELMAGLESERAKQVYAEATSTLVQRFQEERHLRVAGDVDEATAKALNELHAELEGDEGRGEGGGGEGGGGEGEPGDRPGYVVDGRVASRTSAAVAGLVIRVFDRGVGGDAQIAETTTQRRGTYRTTFPLGFVRRRGKDAPDLQVRVFDGDRLLAASAVRYDASHHETIDVLLDDKASRALASEFDTLREAVGAHVRGSLAELQESDERQDVTYLANKTGWDARAIAIAALSEQLSTGSATGGERTGIEPPFFYALLRAGIPADERRLYRTGAATVEAIWRRAIDRGVIPSQLADRVPAALERYTRVATKRLLDSEPLAGPSSFGDLLAVSLPDEDQRAQFAELYQRQAGDLASFWDEARGTFGDEATDRLMLDGQLAYLTLNNAPLVARLHATAGDAGLRRVRDLVDAGLYRSEAWRELLGDDRVPREIPGRDDAERRERYAEALAAQVRLSFPTAVVARMVDDGTTPIGSADARGAVAGFLAEHEDRFNIGLQPVAQYLARNHVDLPAEVTHEVSRIQRVYQITPGDSAMNALLVRGVDSAAAVAGYEQDAFVRAFKDDVGGADVAALIHAKARQVHAAVVGLAYSFIAARNAPGIGVHSDPSIIDPAPQPPANASDVIAYATMEHLFGELDYCACEHCRSILSPAAYLVDLLRFIDRPASEVPAGSTNPLTVLLDRRPDIEHLPLTCENTNTPLPYVDIVNETLEYHIANGLTLAGYVGHSTDGTRTAEELLASPEFVSDAVYDALAVEAFPPPLPFHRPLATLRRHLAKFDAPLPSILEDLRIDDRLERATPTGYGWRDIWMETLRLSRAEHALLTEHQPPAGAPDVMATVRHLYGFAPGATDADVRAVLDAAKPFCRRTGISYQELRDILATRFVNPHADLIPRLERLGVSIATINALKDGSLSDAEFDALITPGLDPSPYGGDIKAWVRDDANFARIMGLLTLANPADPEDTCSLDDAELRYAHPDPAASVVRPFEFVRLIRFIRLWRRLGWSIDQVDQALTALYPAGQAPDDPSDAVNVGRLDAGLLEVLPRLGVLRRVMERLKLRPDRDLLPLLACIAPIDAAGEASLYRQMFLSPRTLDAAFADDGFGNVLGNASERLLDHADALRAAFSLTAGELSDIVRGLGYDATTPLSLDTISAVFRRGWLARKLKLSVRELLLLGDMTGYDAFSVPDPVRPQVVRLIEFIGRLRTLGLKPVQVLYLVWHQDLSGKSTPADEEVTAFARTLRTALAGVEREFVRQDDADGSIARARMALVYGGAATDLFFGLLDSTLVTTQPYDHTAAALDQPILDAAPGQVAYDDFRKRLSFAGYLSPTTRDALKAVPGVTAAFQAAVDALFSQNDAILGPFFARYPELLGLYTTYLTSTDPVEQRRTALLDAFLPALKSRRKRQQALLSVAAAADADLTVANAILESTPVLHAAGDASRPALDDVVAVERSGLAADFFFGPTATGTPATSSASEADLDYAAGGTPGLPPNATTPGAPISGIWSGYLEPPENGFYRLRIDTEATATVALSLDGAPVAMSQAGGSWENATPLELRAGRLYPVAVRVDNVSATLAVRWQVEGRGWEVIPGPQLYSASLVLTMRAVYLRFLKATALAEPLGLTAAELAHLGADADLQIAGDGWINRLPVEGGPDATLAAELRRALDGVLEFAGLKRSLSPGDERLLDVLRDPVAATAQPTGLLFMLTRWEPASVAALLGRFGLAPSALGSVGSLGRLHDACRWVSALGVPAEALIDAATNDPSAGIVRNLESALRARYDESAWLSVLRPITDELRSLQRDALVAHVLHGMRSHPASAHIDTPDKLFEYFLMDVEMDPCMLTSRIRHALSSVQLFVERCLLNLEPRVAPASLHPGQWAWMKRYRVWEANRKVFLYPENWLEPELRDDQSPFFREAMSDLLQGDITEDRGAEAIISYLTKLEEVAKLEVCAVHYEEQGAGFSDDIAHVIARTAGARRKYFYRRRAYGSWTPWERVTLDIEDNPVLPVIWRNRLFLFWLKLVIETEPPGRPGTPSGDSIMDIKPSEVFPTGSPRLKVSAILSWSERFGGQWQPARTSDPGLPLGLGTFDMSGSKRFDRTRLTMSALFWTNDSLRVIVSNQIGSGSSFLLYNPFSSPELRGSKKEPHFQPKRTLDTESASLNVTYAGTGATHAVLDNGIRDGTVEPHHPLGGNAWDPPFFYQDARHDFYVTTDEVLVTVPEWHDYGIVTETLTAAAEIPQLVQVVPPIEKPPVPISRQPGFGVVDPTPMDFFVSEDAYIKTGIGTLGTVRYGDKDIGPSGSEIRLPQTR